MVVKYREEPLITGAPRSGESVLEHVTPARAVPQYT